MALYKHKTYEKTDENGQTWLMISDELEETPCARCGGEAHRQICPGDRRLHHHGCVHTASGGFEAVCNECYSDVVGEWRDVREMSASVRELIDSL